MNNVFLWVQMMTVTCFQYPSNLPVCLSPHTWLPECYYDYVRFSSKTPYFREKDAVRESFERRSTDEWE